MTPMQKLIWPTLMEAYVRQGSALLAGPAVRIADALAWRTLADVLAADGLRSAQPDFGGGNGFRERLPSGSGRCCSGGISRRLKRRTARTCGRFILMGGRNWCLPMRDLRSGGGRRVSTCRRP